MKRGEINLQDLWVNIYEDVLAPDSQYKKTEEILENFNISTSIPFILRYLLFCDQCHDFCEKADRNNL